MYSIHMGVPEMDALWNDLRNEVKQGVATRKEARLYKQIGKAMRLLSNDPRYPGLHSHEINSLTARYGMKVWESYLENNTPAAGRIFWVYGPNQGDITIIGLEPHPNDKSNAYRKVTLSEMGNGTLD